MATVTNSSYLGELIRASHNLNTGDSGRFTSGHFMVAVINSFTASPSKFDYERWNTERLVRDRLNNVYFLHSSLLRDYLHAGGPYKDKKYDEYMLEKLRA
ncbi:MAG: hypothetical protein IJ519_05045, partial [Clostridia bacterium]|nr:hypothetical protein [Clostridia bacterium]